MIPLWLSRAGLAALILAPAAVAQTVNISGAGGTFIYPLASKWFSEYNKLHPDIQINYQSIGSGGGIRAVLPGTHGGLRRKPTGR